MRKHRPVQAIKFDDVDNKVEEDTSKAADSVEVPPEVPESEIIDNRVPLIGENSTK